MVHTYITKARCALEAMGNFGLAADNVNTYKGTKDVASTVMREVSALFHQTACRGSSAVMPCWHVVDFPNTVRRASRLPVKSEHVCSCAIFHLHDNALVVVWHILLSDKVHLTKTRIPATY